MEERVTSEKVMDDSRKTIILVDDNMANLNQGKNILKSIYRVFPAPSAAKLFETLENIIPDLILLDIEMPEMNGYEAIKKLKADRRFNEIPVIFLTSLTDEKSEMEGFNLGAVDYMTKPFSAPLLQKRIANQLLIVENRKAIKDYADNLEKKVEEKTAEVQNLQDVILETVSDMVEFRDDLTGGHIARTQRYMKALIEGLISTGVYHELVSKWDMEVVLVSAQLHDVGKIHITDNILNKPAKLTPEEFELMKTHVDFGVEAIEKIIKKTKEHDFLYHALLITGTHHEKWDGSGYPKHLKGENIPLEGRIMAVADVYDALISERPYKKAFTHEEAKKILLEGSGTHFDPQIIKVFIMVENEFIKASTKTAD